MKKTVIIAIFLVYLASILAIQFFGTPTTLPDSGAYITKITVNTDKLEVINRGSGDKTIYKAGSDLYWFWFLPSAEEGGYTTDEASLSANPNKVRIDLTLEPEDADKDYLMFFVQHSGTAEKPYAVCRWEDEDLVLIFLQSDLTTLTLKTTDANTETEVQVKISARPA